MKSVANGNLNSKIKEKDLEENSKRIESVSRWDDLKVFVAILVITLIAVIVVVVKSAVFLDEVKINRSRNKKTCIFLTQSVNNFRKNQKRFNFFLQKNMFLGWHKFINFLASATTEKLQNENYWKWIHSMSRVCLNCLKLLLEFYSNHILQRSSLIYLMLWL